MQHKSSTPSGSIPSVKPYDRGIWPAPWLGPNGELVLLAITRTHHLNGSPVIVPHGGSRIKIAGDMLAQLDRDDPSLELV